MKLKKTEEMIIKLSKINGHKVYRCIEHGIFSSKLISKCPKCNKKCKVR